MNIQKVYDYYLIFIIIIKVLFLISLFGALYYTYISKSPNSLIKSDNFKFWKNRTEFIFSLSMSFLLLYLFYPWRKNTIHINSETKLLIYAYAIILIVNTNYNEFIENTPWVKQK